MEDNKRWEYGSNYFFPCSWDGEDRSGAVCRVQPAQKVGSGRRGAVGSALELLRGGSRAGVCVCAGVGARQGGVPDPSTLPSKLMQLRSKIHLSYS